LPISFSPFPPVQSLPVVEGAGELLQAIGDVSPPGDAGFQRSWAFMIPCDVFSPPRSAPRTREGLPKPTPEARSALQDPRSFPCVRRPPHAGRQRALGPGEATVELGRRLGFHFPAGSGPFRRYKSLFRDEFISYRYHSHALPPTPNFLAPCK